MHKVRKLKHQLHTATEPSEKARPYDAVDTTTQRSDTIHRLHAHAEAQDAETIDSDTAGDVSEQEASEEVNAAKVFQDQHASEFGYFGESQTVIIELVNGRHRFIFEPYIFSIDITLLHPLLAWCPATA
jgi:hypothetical protein